MAEYTEREAVVAVIEAKQKELCPVGRYGRGYVYGSDREKYDEWEEIIDALENLPAADVAPVRHGRWIPEICESVSKRNRLIRYRVYSCSVCGRNNGRAPQIYCPNCGAKMDLEDKPEHLKTCGNCVHFMGFGDFDLCCKIQKRRLCYENEAACEAFKGKKNDT